MLLNLPLRRVESQSQLSFRSFHFQRSHLEERIEVRIEKGLVTKREEKRQAEAEERREAAVDEESGEGKRRREERRGEEK